MPDEKKAEVTIADRSPGFLYLVVLLFSVFLMLIGMGVFEKIGIPIASQLPEIYSTALTLCLSCIGLGEINFVFLAMIAGLFIVTLILYFVVVKLIGGKNGRKN